MFSSKLIHSEPHKAVEYLRMSSKSQNPRSPDQQSNEIERRFTGLGYPWQVIKKYRDDAISGRYVTKRPAFQEMLRDLKSGTVKASLILVDTFERFGRVEEAARIRQELLLEYGIYVLTADTDFLDPTTISGRAQTFVETIRSTEDGHVKAHNVVRGKRDAAELKHWPGGLPPFGFKLHQVIRIVDERPEIAHTLLVPDPVTRGIIERLFELAENTSFGPTRLARALNEDDGIASVHKPFVPATISYWLDNPIYYGTLRWGVHETGVIQDTRVVRLSQSAEALFIEDFCDAIVTRERWNNVQQIREIRRERWQKSREPDDDADGGISRPPVVGVVLKYPLSGLVHCECGMRMTASSGSAYISVDGDERRYTAYVCPAYLAGRCSNDVRIPETWIRDAAIQMLLDRFPDIGL